MTEWKSNHTQYLDEWISSHYVIRRFRQWTPVNDPLFDEESISASQMYDAIDAQVAELNDGISQIGQLLSKGGLPKPHVQGLENIKNWLGYDSSEEMLEDIPNKDIGDLKKKFAEYSKKEVETGG